MTRTVTVGRTRAELAAGRAALPGRVAVVLTMGALHAGHRALLRAAGQHADSVIATIFVNPLQFGAGEDLERYPRALDADLDMCAEEGAALVFVPAVDTVYPGGPPQVTVHPGQLGDELEGAVRPGHFAGVLTVVLKLLHLTGPDAAFFGEKDYQQLVLVRRMAYDLDLGTEIVGVPTVRETDGLALSSRNAYLGLADRRAARALNTALRAGVSAAGEGAGAVLSAARAVLDAEPAAVPDYLELRSPDLGPAPTHGAARLLVAARVGGTRLIDNMPIDLREP